MLKRRYRKQVILAQCLAIAAGCGDEAGRTGSTSEPAPVQLQAPSEHQPLGLMESELAIGVGIGPEDVSLGNVRAISEDADGRIYVAMLLPSAVRVYTPTGIPLRSLGGPGRGPGEHMFPAGLGVDGRGRMWVVDFTNATYSVFEPTGEFSHSAPRTGSAFWLPWPGQIHAEGIVDVRGRPSSGEWLVRLDHELQVVDSIPLPDHVEGVVPFAPELIWALAPDGGVWHATTDRYQITKRDPRGDPVLSVVRDVYRERLPRAVRREALRGMEVRMGAVGATGPRVRLGDIPRQAPVLAHLWVDPMGCVWVHRYHPDQTTSTEADVFTSAGRYLGTISFPFPVLPSVRPVFQRKYLYVVEQDELGVNVVHRIRMRGAEDAPSASAVGEICSGGVRAGRLG